eukprot:4604699-Amphidinium_carterae.1
MQYFTRNRKRTRTVAAMLAQRANIERTTLGARAECIERRLRCKPEVPMLLKHGQLSFLFQPGPNAHAHSSCFKPAL